MTTRRASALLAVGLCIAGVGCPSETDPRLAELEAKVESLELALGEARSRRVACEEDDRFLYSDAVRALQSGDTALACGRFQTLVDRYPTSALVPFATERIEACAEVRVEETQGSSVRADSDGPILIERAWLRANQFGVPLANVRLKNATDKTIRRYELAIQCYDETGGIVRHLTTGQEWFVAAEVNARIGPGQFAKGGPWTMAGFLQCYRFDVLPSVVRFDDGSVWRR